jgi:hypothetical protein
MKSFARLPLCAGVAVVLISTFVFLLAKIGGPQTEEGLDLLTWARKLGDELHKSELLDARGAPVFRRTFEEKRIAHDLITHHLALEEAVAQLRELNEEVAEAEPNPELRPTLDESSLRNSLLIWVRMELAAHPSEAKDVPAELERELCVHPATEE